jgi:hypothetical protein
MSPGKQEEPEAPTAVLPAPGMRNEEVFIPVLGTVPKAGQLGRPESKAWTLLLGKPYHS